MLVMFTAGVRFTDPRYGEYLFYDLVWLSPPITAALLLIADSPLIGGSVRPRSS